MEHPSSIFFSCVIYILYYIHTYFLAYIQVYTYSHLAHDFPMEKNEFCIDGGAATPHLTACLSGSSATCSGGRGGFWLCDMWILGFHQHWWEYTWDINGYDIMDYDGIHWTLQKLKSVRTLVWMHLMPTFLRNTLAGCFKTTGSFRTSLMTKVSPWSPVAAWHVAPKKCGKIRSYLSPRMQDLPPLYMLMTFSIR